jgi:hypothetical protein
MKSMFDVPPHPDPLLSDGRGNSLRSSLVRSGFLPSPLMADIEKLGAFLPLLGVREVIVTDS